MTGSGNASRRLDAFFDDRTARHDLERTSRFADDGAATPAGTRLEALRAYRDSRSSADVAGLAADETKPSWVSIGPLAVRHGQAGDRPVVSGRVPSLAVSADGRRVYVGSANGGVWRSLDAARTWEPMSDELELIPTHAQSVDSLACGAVALVEGAGVGSDRLYVGTGEPYTGVDHFSSGYLGAGMLRSDDGGSTWNREQAVPVDPNGDDALLGSGVYAIAVDPADRDVAVAATTRGLFRRAAGGTWTREVVAGGDPRATYVVASRQGATTTFYAVFQRGRVFSSTAVNTWSAVAGVPGGPAGVARVTLGVGTSAPVLYAFSSKPNDEFHGLHRMDLAAAPPLRWVTVNGVPGTVLGGQGWYNQGLAVDPLNENTVYIGGSGVDQPAGDEFSAAIYRITVTPPAAAAVSTASTSRLIGRRCHADVHALVMRPGSSDELWVGCDGGVFWTGNARGTGNLFESRNTGLATLTLAGLTAHPTEETWAFAGAQDNGGLRYDGWEVWDHQLGGDGGATVFERGGTNRILNVFHDQFVRRARIDGARYVEQDVAPPTGNGNTVFYPPMEQAPGTPAFVVFGAKRPFVTTNFGTSWSQVNVATPAPAGAFIRSLAVVSNTRFYVGWDSGHVARYDLTGGTWRIRDVSNPAENRAITGMCVDPDPAPGLAGGAALYVCTGGGGGVGPAPGHVWRLDTTISPADPAPLAARWSQRSGPAAAPQLLNIQHNAILADPRPGNHQRLWVAADLGVWTSPDAGATWSEISFGLPDAAVIDLDLVTIADPKTPAETAAGDLSRPFRVLRCSTYGRGVFELPLDGLAQPPVELVLRANQLDQRRRNARVNQPLPAAPGTTTTVEDSPDLFVEVPDANGQYPLPSSRPPTVTELVELPPNRDLLASEPGTPAITRVHVIVRNRGVRKVDGVRVTVLVGPKDAALPPDVGACARGGILTGTGGWKVGGTGTVNGLRGGFPQVVTVAVSSESLPPLATSVGQDYQVIALLHHPDDPFPDGTPTTPGALVARTRHTAMRRVRVASGARRAAPAGGTGLLLSMSTTVLAHRRLEAITAALGAKVAAAAPVKSHPVERRVLAMARAGLAGLEAGPKPRVPAGTAGEKVGSYALLGALGFELPGYTEAFLPGGGWVAEHLRRGTGDPQLSKVAVPSTELALRLAALAPGVADVPARAAVQSFSTGLLASAAAGAVLSPQLADLLAQETNADWSPDRRSRGSAALEHLVRESFLGGATTVPSPASWLPPSAEVPPALWEKYVTALEQTYGLPGGRTPGFGAFEADLDVGFWVDAGRLSRGYSILLDEARATSWSAWGWWGLLTPLLLGPSLALVAARGLPHAKAFFEGGELTERSFFELVTVAEGVGALAPFVYSMAMWGKIPDHTEAFATALAAFLARGALVGAGLGTSGDEGQGAGVRWAALFPLLFGIDVYAALRAALDSGRHPGNAKVFALQTAPAITALTTLGLAGLTRAIGGGDPVRDETKDDVTFWLTTVAGGALLLTAVGIPVALALSHGAGWRSWFVRDHDRLPLLSSVAHAGVAPLTPLAAARVYDAATLWPPPPAPAPPNGVAAQAYPPGMRRLVRVWWEGDGEATIRYGEHTVRVRHGGTETVVDLAGDLTATAVATQLQAGLAGLKAEVVGTDTPAAVLPLPRALADAGDEAPFEVAEALRTGFVRLPTRKGDALVLRQAPRVSRSTPVGRTAAAATPYLVFPADPTKDDADNGLVAAADLAALLLTAAAPSLGPVAVADARPPLPAPAVGEVMQVFRRWNLDERRLDEWRSLVTGHGATAPPADPVAAGQNLLLRPQPAGYQPKATGRDIAEAMGWLPLWRAWLTVAADPAADAGSNAIHARTPQVALPGGPRKPKNGELTAAVAFLLDLDLV